MKLIVGLGNPGKEYENTRHNIGFMIIDNYIKSNNLNIKSSWQTKFKALYTATNIKGETIYFLKPQTFMNLSGISVYEFASYFKIEPKDILIIHDDLDLPFGKYRIKTNSGSGGHNGIKSIIEKLGTNAFVRLKIGISHNHNIDTKDYVLGSFTKEEQEVLNNLYPTFNEIINDFLSEDISKLMNDYNGGKINETK